MLLIHGDADDETPPDHSRRVFDALKGPKQLILVPGARHNGSLRGEVWDQIEKWLDTRINRQAAGDRLQADDWLTIRATIRALRETL